MTSLQFVGVVALLLTIALLRSPWGKLRLLLLRGSWRGRRGDTIGQLRALDEAVALEPRCDLVRWGRAEILQAEGMLTEALDDLDIAMRIAPGEADLYQSRGRIELAKGEFALAASSFERAIALDATTPEHYFFRGTALWLLERPHDALLCIDEGLLHGSEHVDLHRMRGAALWHLERCDEALIALRRATRIAIDDAESYYFIGRVHHDNGDLPRALVALHRALQLEPGQPLYHEARANLLLDLERPSDALRDFRLAIEALPNDVDLRERWIEALESVGYYDEVLIAKETVREMRDGRREFTPVDDEFLDEFDLTRLYDPIDRRVEAPRKSGWRGLFDRPSWWSGRNA